MYTGKLSILFLFLSPYWLFTYPTIQQLDTKDPIFLQQQESVEHFFKAFHQKEEFLPLEIFEYTTERADSLFSISARLLLPYSTVATVNRLSHADLLIEGMTLYVPSMPGIFLPIGVDTELDSIISERLDVKKEIAPTITINEIQGYFLVGEDFSPYERKLFLEASFSFPLDILRITSFYGFRIHPVYGTNHFHTGIDFGAAQNTPVYSSRKGEVSEVGTDPVMGQYVRIDHDFGFSSFYGHLSQILVTPGMEVTSATEIGKVGNTGVSTGSHLHFEILHEGEDKNPLGYLPRYLIK